MRRLAAAAILAAAAGFPVLGAPVPGEAAKVDVAFEAGARGTESLRDDLTRTFVDFGPRWSCVALVDPAAPRTEPTLTLSVLVGEPREETSYEAPLADTERRDHNPETAAAWTARYRVRIEWTLRVTPGGAEARSGHFEIDRSRHQEVIGGDAASLARDEAIEWAVKETLRQMCKGSSEALKRRIDEARASDRSPSR